MPSKNRIKEYAPGGYYHIYNRGVEKRKIFLDPQDYSVFLYLLKYYLSPPTKEFVHPLSKSSGFQPVRARPLTTLHNDATLLAYCLLPNHFHMLIQQHSEDGMVKLMRSLSTTYVMYFNRKYNRVGPLFQGRYKAAMVPESTTGENYLLHLTRYIHLNPKIEMTGTDPVNWNYSSYAYYVGEKVAQWIDTRPILAYFSGAEASNAIAATESYKKFIEQELDNSRGKIGDLVIE